MELPIFVSSGTTVHERQCMPVESSKPTQWARERILSQLHGQQVRIPNLGVMMQDWPHDQNVHRDAIDNKVLQIIDSHALNPSVHSRLSRAKLSDQLAGWYPYAEQERLKALTSFQVWMFIVDDTIDQYSLLKSFNARGLKLILSECKDFVERSLGLRGPLDNAEGAPVYTEQEAVTSFAEMGRTALAQCGEPYRRRIAHEANVTLDAYGQEAENRYYGRVPSTEEYLGYRQASSCIMQVAVMLEFANSFELPEEVMESPEMRELYRSTVAVVWIVNDIVSLRKEILEGFVENLVVLLSEGDVQRGVDRCLAYLEKEIQCVNDAAGSAIRRFSNTPHRDQVSLLAKNCKNMNMSNWQWSMRTPRYCLWDIVPDAEGGYNFTIDATHA